uniref:Uncharacterized protein n=1 Tax=Oryza rufipogon TaxID=4529 RepID=A0A0E0NJQ5_ORYRU
MEAAVAWRGQEGRARPRFRQIQRHGGAAAVRWGGRGDVVVSLSLSVHGAAAVAADVGRHLASARSGGMEAAAVRRGRRGDGGVSFSLSLCSWWRGAAAVAADVMEVVGRTVWRQAAGPRLHQIRWLRPGGGGRGGGPDLASARSGGMEAAVVRQGWERPRHRGERKIPAFGCDFGN